MATEADADGAAVHALRMFGIRPAVIALDLLSSDRAVRRHAVRVALLIHVSDTMSAAARAGLSGRLPRRSAVVATGISSLNGRARLDRGVRVAQAPELAAFAGRVAFAR